MWDHPRTRGVYMRTGMPDTVNGGSSPHTRGLLVEADPAQLPGRIIPARAGFTVAHLRPALDAEDHPRTRGVYGVMRTL